MTPAEELRAAATKVRETASKATPGRWQSEVLPPNERFTRPAYWVTTEYDDSDGTTDVVVADCPWREGDAEWIALASPALAEPLAAWLEAVVGLIGQHPDLARRHVDDEPCNSPHCHIVHNALAVARAINGDPR
jgi:hypothetical protein